MCRVFSCCWKRVFAMTSAFSWQNFISLCPASFCIPRPNLSLALIINQTQIEYISRIELWHGPCYWKAAWSLSFSVSFRNHLETRGLGESEFTEQWSLSFECVGALLLSPVWLFVTPWTVAHQAPLSTDSLGKNSGVGCHFLPQGIFLTQGSDPLLLKFLRWQVDSLPLRHLGSPCLSSTLIQMPLCGSHRSLFT